MRPAHNPALTIGRASRSSATMLASLIRESFARGFDSGYHPDVGNGTQEPRNPTTIVINDLSMSFGRHGALQNLTGAFAAGTMTPP
jgi:hypothetical protein